jgi:hypothetical protein
MAAKRRKSRKKRSGCITLAIDALIALQVSKTRPSDFFS